MGAVREADAAAEGAWLGVLARVYALCLCAPALAFAHRLGLARAWAAPLAPVLAGLLPGVVALAVVGGPRVRPLR